jgi:hypothetical protein
MAALPHLQPCDRCSSQIARTVASVASGRTARSPPLPAQGCFRTAVTAAVAAAINNPYGVAASPDGSIHIADDKNHRMRHVSTAGISRTTRAGGRRAP